MLFFLISTVFSAPVIDQDSVAAFVDQNRHGYEGPAAINYLATTDLNGDGVDDHLIAFTYGWDDNGYRRHYGQKLAAFLSIPSATFEATNVLQIPESDLLFYSDFEVEIGDKVVSILAKKRTPTDAQCCPTAWGRISVGLVDGELRAIEGSWHYDPSLET